MNIFMSYSWSCKTLADFLDESFSEKYIKLIRDIKDLNKLDSIRKFMNQIREADYIIIILNDSYLKSFNCMYEVVQILKASNCKSKIIPIIDENLNIFKSVDRMAYIRFWENELSKFDEEMHRMKGCNANEINNDRKIMDAITKSIDVFLSIISDTNSITYNNDTFQQCFLEAQQIIYNKIYTHEIRNGFVKINSNIQLTDDPILCIDFGTSYTFAAVIDERSKIHLIPDTSNNPSIPSVIAILSDGKYVVGHNALYYGMNNERTIIIKNIKRMIGAKECYVCNDKEFSIQLLISLLIKSIHRNTEEFLGICLKKVLISTPVDYGYREIEIVKESINLSGLQIIRIMQESSVATLVHSQTSKNEENNLFINIDFGGGTLDISVASTELGAYEILQSFGDKNLGGVDYDHLICDFVVEEIQNKYNLNYPISNDSLIYSQILYQSEKVKTMFNKVDSVNLSVDSTDYITGNIISYEVIITKQVFMRITESLNKKIKSMLVTAKSYAIKYSKLYNVELSHILLTGQGSKLFLVREIIEEVFKGIEIIDKYQENAVIRGLALQSGILTGACSDAILLDLSKLQIDVLCSRVGEEFSIDTNDGRIKSNMIYFSNNNNKMYYNLLDRVTFIPTKKILYIKFENIIDEEYKITLYETNLNKDKRIPFYSIPLIPSENVIYKMVVGVDVSNNIELHIYDDEEDTMFHKTIFICDKF